MISEKNVFIHIRAKNSLSKSFSGFWLVFTDIGNILKTHTENMKIKVVITKHVVTLCYIYSSLPVTDI